MVERGRDATSKREKALDSNADRLKEAYDQGDYTKMLEAAKILAKTLPTNKELCESADVKLVR